MKKIALLLCALIVSMAFVLCINAAETVIYSNDFSDAESISDFIQYRSAWEIRDGALYLTGVRTLDDEIKDNHNSHIVYQAPVSLDDYIVEVDMHNVQTWAGLIFNVQQEKVNSVNSGFYGYSFTVSKNASFCAVGSAGQGKWLGNINLGTTHKDVYAGTDLHLSVIVKDGVMGFNAYNIVTGNKVYSYTYSVGSHKNDGLHFGGTVGFRALAEYSGRFNEANLHFDNLVITTAKDTTVASVVNRDTVADSSQDAYEIIYTNTFDSADDIDEFKQFGGTWEVRDGRLWLTDVGTESSSLIIYNGDKYLKTLADYAIDVDMYNVQTQAGVIIRSAVDSIKGNSKCEDFYGYFAFVSFDGKKGALGYGAPNGNWGGNIVVSENVTAPGANVHIRVEARGNTLAYYLSDIDSGKLLFSTVKQNSTWSMGSFGFRFYNLIKSGDKAGEILLDNLRTSLDNLVITSLDADFEVPEDKGDFDYTLKGGKAIITAYLGSKTKITVPETIDGYKVIAIGENAFYRNSYIKEVVLPKSITYIAENAFGVCTSLSDINWPVGLVSIGKNAFQNCRSLRSVVLPQSVKSIGSGAFYACISLESFTFPHIIEEIGKNVFWCCENLTTVTMPGTMPLIPDAMFYGCTKLDGDSLWIPSAVVSIGDSAFRYCGNIEAITVPETVKTIGASAFSGCGKLKMLVIYSTDAFFGEKMLEASTDVRIICYRGSTAAVYAQGNGMDFAYITCSEHQSFGTVIISATSTAPGSKVVYCAECGVEISREELPVTDDDKMDFDGDGSAAVEDVLPTIDEILQSIVLEDVDIDGDGKFSLRDILLILKSILG